MAENKKSIVVYADWINKFEELEDDEAGRLIKHFFRYVNDLNPEYPDRTTKLMFIDIKNTLKRDLDRWEQKSPERIEKARIAGLASAEARKLKKELKATNELEIQLNPTKSTVSVSVTDSVNKNINANLTVDWEKLKLNFNELTGKKTKVVSNKVKGQINARLKEGYTKQDLWNAIVNCFNDPYHKENPKYLTLEFISRSDKMEKYSADIKKQKPKVDKL